MKTSLLPLLLALSLPAQETPARDTPPLTFSIDPFQVLWRISDNLTGANIDYQFERDDYYRGDRPSRDFAALCSNMRFPGGTQLKAWDWSHSSGDWLTDPWNPEVNSRDPKAYPLAPPEHWMSLDEHILFLKKTGLRPLIGVNWASGAKWEIANGNPATNIQASIRRASKQAAHIARSGLKNTIYYIGNEDLHWAPAGKNGAETFANAVAIICRHSQAIKKADPGCQTMLNWNDLTPHDLRHLLTMSLKDNPYGGNLPGTPGDYLDYIEFHQKWPISHGVETRSTVTPEQWTSKKKLTTLYHYRGGRPTRSAVIRDQANTFRQTAREAGYPNLKFADVEWGLNGAASAVKFKGFTPHSYGLLIADNLQERILGNYDLLSFWYYRGSSHRALLQHHRGKWHPTPASLAFSLIRNCQGSDMIPLQGGDQKTHGFASKAPKGKTIDLFLLNKHDQPKPIRITGLPETAATAKTLLETPAKTSEIRPLTVQKDDTAFTTTLPPMSYTHFRFE